MNLASIGFLVLGVIGGLLALVGVLGALKGTPVRAVKPFGGGKLPAVNTETIESSGKVSDGGTLFVRGPAVKSADGVTSELLFLIQANVTK